jgi:hypothetical protein
MLLKITYKFTISYDDFYTDKTITNSFDDYDAQKKRYEYYKSLNNILYNYLTKDISEETLVYTKSNYYLEHSVGNLLNIILVCFIPSSYENFNKVYKKLKKPYNPIPDCTEFIIKIHNNT